MLEQELASIIRFILMHTADPTPYYHSVPEGFLVPSVYFPVPEITSSGDTFNTYSLEYTWFIKFFHKDSQQTQALALMALTALQRRKNVIPIIDVTGIFTGQSFRLQDPSLKSLENAAQLTLKWKSSRPYDSETVPKMQSYIASMAIQGTNDNMVSQ